MNTLTIKLSDYPNINFNHSDFVNVETVNNERIYAEIETIESLTWWQERGLSYTRTGYGSKIPTSHKVKINNRLYRVYCHIYSNSGTLYILVNKQRVVLY